MRKIFLVVISVLMSIGLLSGCDIKSGLGAKNEKPLRIVTTIFPEYDWVREVLGDKFQDADVTMLIDNGVDLHSYQPTADDIIKISNCDLFIYVGGESDEWVEDVLEDADNENMVALSLLNVLGEDAVEEEMVEGMEEEDHDHEEEEEHEHEFDEHVWLSLKNAAVFCEVISEELAYIDPDNGDIYRENAKNYIEQLNKLDKEYENTVSNASKKTVLFGDRFPFRYLVNDYGIEYYAAFSGCSAESEASFETVAFLANKVNELGLNYVLTIENSNQSIAQTIIENTEEKNQQTLILNSMQSLTKEDADNGKTYLSIMEDNLNTLRDALS